MIAGTTPTVAVPVNSSFAMVGHRPMTATRTDPPETMIQLPPVVYHLAEAANWPSIERNGLSPATHLLQRFVHDDAWRAALQQRQRLRHVVLAEGVEIRD